jgi:two-component system, OmpR family, phosphate regulon response regulator OmpR
MNDQKPKVIAVDDDAEMRALLQRYLTDQGMAVRTEASAERLDRLLAREPFDVLVLDLMMPGEDGLAVCRRLRAAGETIPIIMLTARGDPIDRIVGLEMGADDYLPKPFNPRELVARIQALLRRQAMHGSGPRPPADAAVTFGVFALYPQRRALERDGEPVLLTSGEFALLAALAAHPNRPLGRERLIELAFGRDCESSDRAVDVQILRLRRVIEADPGKPRFIQTVRGFGYVFVPDGEPR